MGKATKSVAQATSLALLLAGTGLAVQTAHADEKMGVMDEQIKLGKQVAYDRKKGNCLACHMAGDGESPGDIGPPLIAMKARFPDAAKLRAQIYDPAVANPDTRMPPFGKHQIVSEKELDAIVAFLYTL